MKKKKIKILTENDTKTLKQALDEFVQYQRSRLLVNDTILNYEKTIRYFSYVVGWDCNIYNITLNDINAFIFNYTENHKNNTVRGYCKFLRAFFRYHKLDNLCDFKMPSEDFDYKDIFTQNELKILIEPPKRKNFAELRNHAMVCFLIATGVRCRTLINVKVKDIHFKDNVIWLEHTKTKKKYAIPMSLQLSRTLKKYLSAWEHNEEDYLFPNQFGEKLGNNVIGTLLNKYNRNRGVNKTGVHIYRRTFASNYVKNGGNIAVLQRLLGHSKITTTQKYVTLANEDLKNNYEQYNMLDILTREPKKHIKGVK